MTLRIVGLGGLLRSGKDSFADELVDQFGAVKMGMSDPLIKALTTLDPLIPLEESTETIRLSELVERVGYVNAKKEPEVRALLQRFGTEVGREQFGKDFWVDIAASRVLDVAETGRAVVITGIRFPNEVDMIGRIGGESVWIERPGLVTAGHPSESSVHADDFDTVIHNDGDLLDLQDEAINFGDSRNWAVV
jgi:hypothetical protein